MRVLVDEAVGADKSARGVGPTLDDTLAKMNLTCTGSHTLSYTVV